MNKNETHLKPVTERILDACDGSTTELAKKLTFESNQYYTVNQVSHWCKTKRIPPEHAATVSAVFEIPIEEVVPDMFKAHHTNKR